MSAAQFSVAVEDGAAILTLDRAYCTVWISRASTP
jgi:hypothetical protein